MFGGLGAVAVYNGYFGAGSGILLIALLLLTAEPVLHRANAVKNVILAASDLLPALMFAVTANVVWTAAIPLASRHGRRRSHRAVHRPAGPPRHPAHPHRLHGLRPRNLAAH